MNPTCKVSGLWLVVLLVAASVAQGSREILVLDSPAAGTRRQAQVQVNPRDSTGGGFNGNAGYGVEMVSSSSGQLGSSGSGSGQGQFGLSGQLSGGSGMGSASQYGLSGGQQQQQASQFGSSGDYGASASSLADSAAQGGNGGASGLLYQLLGLNPAVQGLRFILPNTAAGLQSDVSGSLSMASEAGSQGFDRLKSGFSSLGESAHRRYSQTQQGANSQVEGGSRLLMQMYEMLQNPEQMCRQLMAAQNPEPAAGQSGLNVMSNGGAGAGVQSSAASSSAGNSLLNRFSPFGKK